MNTLSVEQIKKELYKTKVDAVFSHYVSGNLYYTVLVNDSKDLYQFPIKTIEEGNEHDRGEDGTCIILSKDLGTTQFTNKMRASELNRWIAKAIEAGEFIKVS